MSNFRDWFKRIRLSETIILWGLALMVGLATGVGVWLFKRIILIISQIAFNGFGGWLSSFGRWTLFIIPVLGGIIVGIVRYFYIHEEHHGGVSGIMESVALAGGRLRYQQAPAVIISSAL